MATRSRYATGVLLLIAAAITYSTAGLFTKGVAAGAWAVIFWRGLFAAGAAFAWIVTQRRTRTEFARMGAAGWTVVWVGALGQAAFIAAFKLTSIANVALIYAAAPLIAGVLAWVLIGERIGRRTLLGALGALVGVAIIVGGSLGTVQLLGDGLALVMTVVMAAIMVIYRARPDTPSAGPAVFQSLVLLPLAFSLGAPLAVAPVEIGILAAFGLLFAIASVTLAEGAKRVPSGQTALLSALETPLAPLLAFAVLAEVPSIPTLVGGTVVLIAVLASLGSDTEQTAKTAIE